MNARKYSVNAKLFVSLTHEFRSGLVAPSDAVKVFSIIYSQ